MSRIIKSNIFPIVICCMTWLCGQTINRYGTTAANFLEIGVGSGPSAMGEAYVAVANDVSSIYWNPAGLASLSNPSALFMVQPWLDLSFQIFLEWTLIHISTRTFCNHWE